jgi:hypothetical protein
MSLQLYVYQGEAGLRCPSGLHVDTQFSRAGLFHPFSSMTHMLTLPSFCHRACGTTLVNENAAGAAIGAAMGFTSLA